MFKIKDKAKEQAEFHAKRLLGVGSSDVAAILGISPWRTAYSLWLEKTKRVTPPDISNLPHIQRGVQGELIARTLFEQKTGRSYKPKNWSIPNTPFRANDDGYSLDDNTTIEIKCQSRAKHEEARMGKIPDYYLCQVHMALAVSKARLCFFLSFWPENEDLIVIPVELEQDRREKLLAIVKDWWDEHVVKDIPPPLTPKDKILLSDEYAIALCREYKRVKHEGIDVDESLRLRLHELTSIARPSVVCDGVMITMSFDGHYRITIKD
jgi:putative phage-type endonuclease